MNGGEMMDPGEAHRRSGPIILRVLGTLTGEVGRRADVKWYIMDGLKKSAVGVHILNR